jgi:hypothetical protein
MGQVNAYPVEVFAVLNPAIIPLISHDRVLPNYSPLTNHRSTGHCIVQITSQNVKEKDMSLFSKTSKLVLGPNQPHIHGFSGVKRTKNEAGHSFPCSIKVKNDWSYNSAPLFTSKACRGTNLPLPLPDTVKTWTDCMNSSRANSRVNSLKTSDVSQTHSVSILRESDYFP